MNDWCNQTDDGYLCSKTKGHIGDHCTYSGRGTIHHQWRNKMTFQEAYDSMTQEQRDCDLTIYCTNTNEFYPAQLLFSDGTDALDIGHPYLMID